MEFEELADALDGLSAYDAGAIDSGIHDPALKAKCTEAIREDPSLPARVAQHLYGRPPYTQEDVAEFLDWADSL